MFPTPSVERPRNVTSKGPQRTLHHFAHTLPTTLITLLVITIQRYIIRMVIGSKVLGLGYYKLVGCYNHGVLFFSFHLTSIGTSTIERSTCTCVCI